MSGGFQASNREAHVGHVRCTVLWQVSYVCSRHTSRASMGRASGPKILLVGRLFLLWGRVRAPHRRRVHCNMSHTRSQATARHS